MKFFFRLSILSSLFFAVPAVAQYGPPPQFDVGFGVGTVLAPSSNSATGNHSPQTIGGGAYLNFSGDYIFWRHVGVEGEVAWRASQNLWGGYQPFRPIFYDVNAIYAPPLGKHAQLELLGGIGGFEHALLYPDLHLRLLHVSVYELCQQQPLHGRRGSRRPALRAWRAVSPPRVSRVFHPQQRGIQQRTCNARGSDSGIFLRQ